MEQQAYHIQVLLVDELNWYKEKEREVVDKHIKILQEVYQDSYWDTLQLMIIDKGKQKKDTVQDEVLLYKSYNILTSSSSETSSPDTQILQDKINNLEKVLKMLQSPVKTILFTPPNYYKTIQASGKKNRIYWNDIAYQFL